MRYSHKGKALIRLSNNFHKFDKLQTMLISDRQYMYMLRYNQFSIFIMIIISISDLIILGYKYTMEERLC
jgi:hypothetical protein